MSDLNSAGPLPPEPPGPVFEPEPRPAWPEDLQTPWGWGELVLFLVVAFVCLLIAGAAMAGVAMVWWHVKPANLQALANTSATFNALVTGAWYGLALLYLAATVRLGHHLPFWRTIGWRRLPRWRMSRPAACVALVIGGMAMAVVVELGSRVFKTKANLPIEALFHDRRGILWLMALGILLAPAVEETLFRGYLYPVLARALGVEGGVVVTGILFGAVHAKQLWGGWGQILLIVIVGIVLTWVRAKTGTVVASWLLHFGYNTFLFAGFYFATGGLRHLPPVH